MIVPAWNSESTIEETLRSVAGQTYPHLEIIIVDDGSTDTTAAVAERFCASEPRARLIRKGNGGVASARNAGIAEAKGEWIAPIDADDLWHPTKIEKQVAAALAASERPGFVYCWHRLIDESGRVTGSGPRVGLSGPAFNQLAYCNPVENGSALLLSAKSVAAVGGYDESLRAASAQGCEDVMIQLRIARLAPVAVVPEHLVGHRRHGSNMSRDFDQIVRSWQLVYRRIGAEQESLRPEVARWVQGKCASDIAVQRALSGRYGPAFAELLRALRLDPVRSVLAAAHRLARLGGRRMSGRSLTPEMPHFDTVDPKAGEANADRSVLVERVNRRRLARLAAADRR